MSARRLIEAVVQEDDKRWVKCREGWISYKPVGHENFYVTATNERAMTVHGSELHEIIRELERKLGGRVQR